ncbi:MAG: 6,7-dimethyl-8-ribityllumazine synthase [Calditrichaeota bacterium]|nr:MAG: 6,7-dimethyl-8-ribityllumazine synthase [Calditrichota bacterium]
MRELSGSYQAGDLRFAIVVSRFNDAITRNLLEGALDCLRRQGCDVDKQVRVYWVPGALELPVTAGKIAAGGGVDAIICLGAVIRGATPHFDVVCSGAVSGISRVSLDHRIPVIFGVLTTDTIEQALERAGTKAGNRGWDAALAALEMANLFRQIDGENRD